MMKNVLKQFDLSGKVAIVTGTSSAGMGQASAVALAQAGCNIFAVDINVPSKNTKELIESYGVKCVEYKFDISKVYETDELIAEAVKEFGHVDYLINAVGVYIPNNGIENFDYDKDYVRSMDLNLNGQTSLDIAFCKQLIKQGSGGRIINFASVSAHTFMEEGLAYSISKAGVVALTKVLAVAMRKHNVTVNCITPGSTLTDQVRSIAGDSPNTFETLADMGLDVVNMGSPEDLMGMILVLCSDAGSRFNGVELIFDGGDILN